MINDLPEKLFGTDGVRGVVGEVLTAELALELGKAAAGVIEAPRPQVVIVRDTRESGPMLEAALAAGIAEAGGDVFRAGVLPTPAASIIARRLGFDLAAVISASHNPWQDNGIKFFDSGGRKLDDDAEHEIEAAVRAGAEVRPELGRIRELEGALEDYLRELAGAFRPDLSGLRVVLDCANGATYRAAPAIFGRLGAVVDVICDRARRPQHQPGLRLHAPGAARRARDAPPGPRSASPSTATATASSRSTRAAWLRDGDELIALIAAHLRERDALAGGIAVTVMSNYGLHRAMQDAGIEVATTPVGDRSVAAELERRGWALGGEQSGHLIWTEFAPTGDGIAAALLAPKH